MTYEELNFKEPIECEDYKQCSDFVIKQIGAIIQNAIEKLKAGADLIQLYTGFIYEGPSLVKRILKKLLLNS